MSIERRIGFYWILSAAIALLLSAVVQILLILHFDKNLGHQIYEIERELQRREMYLDDLRKLDRDVIVLKKSMDTLDERTIRILDLMERLWDPEI